MDKIHLRTSELIEELYRRSEEWSETPSSCTRPIPWNADWSLGYAYGRSMMELDIELIQLNSQFHCSIFFIGIDDGNWSLVGPSESLEKAQRRYALAKEACSPKELHCVPDKLRAQALCNRLGLSLNL